MTKEEALKVLEDHQKWRLGDDEIEATNPKELTKAVKVAFASLSESMEDKYGWRKVSEELPLTTKPVLVKSIIPSGEETIQVARLYKSGWITDTYFKVDVKEWKPILL